MGDYWSHRSFDESNHVPADTTITLIKKGWAQSQCLKHKHRYILDNFLGESLSPNQCTLLTFVPQAQGSKKFEFANTKPILNQRVRTLFGLRLFERADWTGPMDGTVQKRLVRAARVSPSFAIRDACIARHQFRSCAMSCDNFRTCSKGSFIKIK